jgi:hypothetical protein
VPQESSMMNTLSDITNIENETEVIFVPALNINLLFVFNHFRKKLEILISLANFFRKFENVLYCIFNSVGHIITREIYCINKT